MKWTWILALAVVCAAAQPAEAKGAKRAGKAGGAKGKSETKTRTETRTETRTSTGAEGGSVEAEETKVASEATAPTKIKTKTYTFGAMDVEGKLKTPQLLYFLNRVKLELDMSAPDRRSFMKELERSADDKNL